MKVETLKRVMKKWKKRYEDEMVLDIANILMNRGGYCNSGF